MFLNKSWFIVKMLFMNFGIQYFGIHYLAFFQFFEFYALLFLFTS